GTAPHDLLLLLQRADRRAVRLAASRHQLLLQAHEARSAAEGRAEVGRLAHRRRADREGKEPWLRDPAGGARLLSPHSRHVESVVTLGDLQDRPRALDAVSGNAQTFFPPGEERTGERT